jgi:hypothetical protein
MLTDPERASAVRSLARSLAPGGLLFLDVREERAARRRADGNAHTRHADLGAGAGLTFTARTTFSDGMLRVEEQYDLVRPGTPAQRSRYSFSMRPWTESELRTLLQDSGLHNVEIAAGVGRRTPDRLFVVAS